MEFIGAFFQFLGVLLGFIEERVETREQCAQMQAAGAVPYPLTDEQYDRIEQCKRLQREGE
jgi:hypothetical protein